MVEPLVKAGYTVFVINHRAAPQFRYPAAVEDAERAVRFIRHNAARYGVSPARIGGIGASSGAYLTTLLGVRSGPGDKDDPDPVNREDARLQSIVTLCAPEDLTADFPTYSSTALASFLGTLRQPDKATAEWKLYRDASPLTYVSSDDPPTLLIHGDKDGIVPFEQAEKMEQALRQANVAAKLIRLPGAGHQFAPKPEYPDFTSEMTRWFDDNLVKSK
jgi:acetyl esterase/lipase